ncbi:hypothetical protein L873DRAFT_1831838 [Choiromyces venosus 120613-1]|uniref:Uncharacterized protein n=1 Tax=Choiromyces venosus 120613-1 TaxID=1336337 RepID=A0A3N4IUQ4_9PEZI|nr:hypothetical protein L873DRAFT_1831838 [Choiromyces venosus 120613-1]
MRIPYEEDRSKGRQNHHYRPVMEWNTDFRRKRPPSDDLLEEQPLSKRLEKLSLVKKVELLNKPQPFPPSTPTSGSPLSRVEAERMDVDNVVFIENLDEEIASCDSEDNPDSKKLIFLPDIEKRLTRVPYLLAENGARGGGSGGGKTSTDVVLYSVPSSLSVSEERDSVRRIIIEARNRIRKRQADEVAAAAAQTAGMLTGDGEEGEYEWDSMEMGGDIGGGGGFYEDPDAMDIG